MFQNYVFDLKAPKFHLLVKRINYLVVGWRFGGGERKKKNLMCSAAIVGKEENRKREREKR